MSGGGGGGNVLHSENIHDKSLNSKDMAIIFPLFLFFNIGKKNITHYLRKAFRQSARLVFKTVLHHYTVYKI